MRERHGVEPQWATEAVNDPEALWYEPDYRSRTGRSLRVIGYSPAAGKLLSVILVAKPEGPQDFHGASGWPSNSRDRRAYREGMR